MATQSPLDHLILMLVAGSVCLLGSWVGMRHFARCERHGMARLDLQEEINRKYAPESDVPPAGFDPTYAGERWEDDY